MHNPSIEFLIHYPPCIRETCKYTWSSGDRLPLNDWFCPKCGQLNGSFRLSTHYSALESDTEKFRSLLGKLAKSSETTID